MKSVMAISGRWRAPYTVKKRSAAHGGSGATRAMALATSSAPRFDAAYGDSGTTAGASSRAGSGVELP